MIAQILLAVQAAATAPPAVLPPADWSTLPELRYLHAPADAGDVTGFVRAEVKAGRCAAAIDNGARGWSIRVDLAVLAAPDGQPRRIVPRAIQCPSVEQYAAGLVSSLARGNIDTGASVAEGWYRTSLVFAWPA